MGKKSKPTSLIKSKLFFSKFESFFCKEKNTDFKITLKETNEDLKVHKIVLDASFD
jgi:hypothetical protein